MPVPLEPSVIEWRCTSPPSDTFTARVACDEDECRAKGVHSRHVETALAFLDLVRAMRAPEFPGWRWYDAGWWFSPDQGPRGVSRIQRNGHAGSTASAAYTEDFVRLLEDGSVELGYRVHHADALTPDSARTWEISLRPLDPAAAPGA